MTNRPLYRYARKPVLLPCVLLLALGIAINFAPITTETRHFLAGILIGAGAGGAIAEFAAMLERREAHQELADLRAETVGKCRRAYRLGEHFFNFQSALAQGNRSDKEVTQFRSHAGQLGMQVMIDNIIKGAPASCAGDALYGEVVAELHFISQSLPVFFDLGNWMFALRAIRDETAEAAARDEVLGKVPTGLTEAARYADDDYVVEAWRRLESWWAAGRLTGDDAQAVVQLFHLYLLTLGTKGGEFGQVFIQHQRLIRKLVKVPDRDNAIKRFVGEVLAAGQPTITSG
jgi:hypothetical protein